MLTHSDVRLLEDMVLDLRIVPDRSSSSNPAIYSDTPKHWYIVYGHTELESDSLTEFHCVGIIQNSHAESVPLPEAMGKVHAVLGVYNPELCPIPQSQLNSLKSLLRDLVCGNVYDANQYYNFKGMDIKKIT